MEATGANPHIALLLIIIAIASLISSKFISWIIHRKGYHINTLDDVVTTSLWFPVGVAISAYLYGLDYQSSNPVGIIVWSVVFGCLTFTISWKSESFRNFSNWLTSIVIIFVLLFAAAYPIFVTQFNLQ